MGDDVGAEVGEDVGLDDGVEVGEDVGLDDGVEVGKAVGLSDGLIVGVCVGILVGDDVGTEVGDDVGLDMGCLVGSKLGNDETYDCVWHAPHVCGQPCRTFFPFPVVKLHQNEVLVLGTSSQVRDTRVGRDELKSNMRNRKAGSSSQHTPHEIGQLTCTSVSGHKSIL